jgi:hypothetical protein
MILTSIPAWMEAYTNENKGTTNHIAATMKVRTTRLQYTNFTGDLRKTLTEMQCHRLEKVFFNLSKSLRLTVFYLSVPAILNLCGLTDRLNRAYPIHYLFEMVLMFKSASKLVL